MESLSQQQRRKVRFSLPEYRERTANIREHGTAAYVNGTLITSKRPQIEARNKVPIVTHVPVNIQILPKISQEDNNHFTTKGNLISQQSLELSPPPPRIVVAPAEIDYRKYSTPVNYNTPTPNYITTSSKRFIPVTAKIGPVERSRETTVEKIEKLRARHIVVITKPPKPIVHPKMENNIVTSDRFSRFRLLEDILLRKRRSLKLAREAEIRKPPSIDLQRDKIVKPTNQVQQIFSPEYNTNVVTDLLQRWNRFRYREATKIKSVSDMIANRKDPLETVAFRDRIKADVRRFGCYKMSLERDPAVTTLLRAARDSDEHLLKIVLKKVLVEGISKEALNSTDKSGRTAISYICSTNLTNFLDVLLQIPGIDVNKPDNEGNTPLHFAAQAGQTDALNMMLTRCRNLKIDAKNCLGFTPLMKAAIQGRTRCAKLLLFAGGSPMEIDSGRGLKAEEWARFCGREACADMLEKCTKVRMLDNKINPIRGSEYYQPKVTLVRSKTNPTHGNSTNNSNNNNSQITDGFRSKFKRFLPFGFSLKDKQTSNNHRRDVNNSKKDLVNYLSNSAFCGTGPATITTTTNGKSQQQQQQQQLLTTLVRPLEVPKLEVTPANNQHLIKKYESKLLSQSPQAVRN